MKLKTLAFATLLLLAFGGTAFAQAPATAAVKADRAAVKADRNAVKADRQQIKKDAKAGDATAVATDKASVPAWPLARGAIGVDGFLTLAQMANTAGRTLDRQYFILRATRPAS